MTLYINGTSGISGVDGSAGTPAIQGTDANTGISFPAADTIAFNEGGAEAARIDSSGRFLVGTSTSLDLNAPIQAASTTFGVQSFRFSSSATGTGGAIDLARSNSGTVGTTSAIVSGQGLGIVRFRGAGDGSTYLTGAQIEATSDGGTVSATSMPTRLVFSVTEDAASSPTQRMRINNAGKLTAFCTGGTHVLSTNVTATSNIILLLKNNASDLDTGTNVCIVRADGDLENANNSYTGISDVKLKENIIDANSQWSDLKSLQVRNYSFKPETGYGTHTQIGLIAQEVELISPGLVSESPDLDKDGNELGTVTKSVNYSVLYMKAVKALQEAMERIEQLEAKVAALEAA